MPDAARVCACCAPPTLDQDGFQPRGPLPDARRSPLAGALVEPGYEPRPGQQMPSCRKRRHVGADLAQNDFGRHSAHARDRDQSCDRVAKRRKQLLDPSIEGSDMSLQLLDQAKMMGNQEAMMRCHPAIESGDQFGSGTLQAGRSTFGQLGGDELLDGRFTQVNLRPGLAHQSNRSDTGADSGDLSSTGQAKAGVDPAGMN